MTSETDSDRWFFSGNLSANRDFGALYLGGRVGLLVAQDNLDGFTESNGTIIGERKTKVGRLVI